MKTIKLFLISIIILFSTVVYGQKKYRITDIQELDKYDKKIESSNIVKKFLGKTVNLTELDNSLILLEGNNRRVFTKKSSSLRSSVYVFEEKPFWDSLDRYELTINKHPFTNKFKLKIVNYYNYEKVFKKRGTTIYSGKEL